MKVKAVVSFCTKDGNCAQGEVRDIPDKSLVQDLLKAGYVVKVDRRKKGEKEDVD